MQANAQVTKLELTEDPKLRNQLITLYAKCRGFGYACKLIEQSPERDMVSWSAQNGFSEEALMTFRDMHLLALKCNEFGLSIVLKVCSCVRNLVVGKQVHSVVVVGGFEPDVFVLNTLVVMYAKCEEFSDSKRLFDVIEERNVVTWNALISCYVQSDFCDEALVLFQEMVKGGVLPMSLLCRVC